MNFWLRRPSDFSLLVSINDKIKRFKLEQHKKEVPKMVVTYGTESCMIE
jgi:hypothetical protein